MLSNIFAVIANGLQTICKTQRQLECILALYPYPKFKKCKDETQAREWLRRNGRCIETIKYEKYGETSIRGYAEVEYFISYNNIYYNIDTKQLGYIRINRFDEHVQIDYRGYFIKVKITAVCLNDNLIVHHIIAVRRILRLLGDFIDVDLKLHDISIFLALTKYSGKNYVIIGAQKEIKNRIGGVSFTVHNFG